MKQVEQHVPDRIREQRPVKKPEAKMPRMDQVPNRLDRRIQSALIIGRTILVHRGGRVGRHRQARQGRGDPADIIGQFAKRRRIQVRGVR